MIIARRRFLHLAAGAAASRVVCGHAWAQSYPSRPVRLIVGFIPGGAGDILARLIGVSLSDQFGQPFIIENRPGAGSNIATAAVVRAPPDGYTLLFVIAPNAINASLYDRLDFDFVRDIAPVASLTHPPLAMVVNPAFAPATVPEFVAYAKASPIKLNMASAGNGTIHHLAGELFELMTGVNMLHVPYRGGAAAITDLLGGRVDVLFSPLPEPTEQIRAGRLRALAVTSARRVDALPGVSPVADFVPGYEVTGWNGIGAPRGTPVEVIDRLNSAINAALADAKVKTRLADLGTVPFPSSPAAFAKLIAEETEKWDKVIKFAGIKSE
jgi:tripartite-type tricarboxylate transporter receptor subunit TctC